jgi:hypothetical protein
VDLEVAIVAAEPIFKETALRLAFHVKAKHRRAIL